MKITLSVLWGRVKMDPSSFIAECYSVDDAEELAQRLLFLRTVEKCSEKEQLLRHLINHQDPEVRNLVRLVGKDDGLRLRTKRKNGRKRQPS